MNVMLPFTVLASVFTYIWPFVRGNGPVVAITVLYGTSSGAFVGLIAGPIMAMGPVEDVGRRTGMYFSVMAIGALAGPPISGAIASATGGYEAVGIYAGTFGLVGKYIICAQLLGQVRLSSWQWCVWCGLVTTFSEDGLVECNGRMK
jgi:MCP family monocarboxylic acid transporter-like MFS transporter 10